MANRFIIVALILLAIDLYVYQAFRIAFPESRNIRLYWVFSMLVLITVIMGMVTHFAEWPKFIRVYWTALIFIVYFSKVFILPFLLGEDIFRVGKWIYTGVSHAFTDKSYERDYTRSVFLGRLALGVAAIPFLLMVKGMVWGARDFVVKKIKIPIRNLPDAFEDLRIVQISDIHIGTFLNDEPLKKAFHMVQELRPDIIFFTGDLVNNIAGETDGFREVLSSLKAPMGVYSILGNHDYGDYIQWDSPQLKKDNLQHLKDFQISCGWRLLLNEHVLLTKNEETIALAGVENWGGRNFAKYGNLKAALEGIPENMPVILLSHDPSHWTLQVSKKFPEVDLTLSGHTHGMQFGVDNRYFRWSPSKYFYKHWAGLYREKHQHLYVNVGLGTIGYPGRIGIMPEITLITLEKALS